MQPDLSSEFAVINPMTKHELVLVLDARVDEIAEQPALDAVVGLRRIIGRPIRQATSDQPVGIVATAGLPLARDWLTSWIDAACVRANRTAQAPGIARPIGIHVFEVV